MIQITKTASIESSMVVPILSLKNHVAVDADESYYNDMLTEIHDAAVEYIESKSRLVFRQSTYSITYDSLPDNRDPLYIPLWPVVSVSSVSYKDVDGATQTIALGDLQVELQSQPAAIYPLADEHWPMSQSGSQRAVTVVATVGALSQVPAMAKHAIKLLVAHWFRNREAVLVGTVSNDMEKALDALLVQFRKNHWQSFGVFQ